MTLSKKRDRIRKRRERAARALLGDRAGLMKRLGDMRRALEAKTARVEWQSGGILMLHDKIATLEARLATQPAMQDTADKQRITHLEADLARLELMVDSMLREGELT